MSKSLYFKPKCYFWQYKKWIDKFINEFSLNIIKQNKKIYYTENNDMLIKIEPKFVSVLVYEQDNNDLIKKLKKYFYK